MVVLRALRAHQSPLANLIALSCYPLTRLLLHLRPLLAQKDHHLSMLPLVVSVPSLDSPLHRELQRLQAYQHLCPRARLQALVCLAEESCDYLLASLIQVFSLLVHGQLCSDLHSTSEPCFIQPLIILNYSSLHSFQSQQHSFQSQQHSILKVATDLWTCLQCFVSELQLML